MIAHYILIFWKLILSIYSLIKPEICMCNHFHKSNIMRRARGSVIKEIGLRERAILGCCHLAVQNGGNS